MTCMYAKGGAAVSLFCCATGRTSQPAILFVHGWSCSQDVWAKQFGSDALADYRLVSFDLRGHGYSERPIGDDHYTDGKLFADDIAGVIDTFELVSPVIVGWSSGSLMVADYVRHFGHDAVSGLVMVSGLYGLGIDMPDEMLGTGPARYMLDTMSDDFECQSNAMRDCITDMIANPKSGDISAMLSRSTMTPPAVRAAMMTRVSDQRDVLREYAGPVLVVHGEKDPFIRPTMARALASCSPASTLSLYDNAAHMPFWEDDRRFNAELRTFADRAFGRQAER